MEVQRLDPQWAAPALALTRRAIRRTEGRQYTPEQVRAWMSGMNESRFRTRLAETTTFGVVEDGALLGFANYLEDREELDYLYVDPDAWGRGVGRCLVREIERHARTVGATCVRVDASLLARPMLERLGYSLERENRKQAGGVVFENAWMVLDL